MDEPVQGQRVPKALTPFHFFHIVEIVFYWIVEHQLFSVFSDPSSVLQIQVHRLEDRSKCFSHNVLCRFQDLTSVFNRSIVIGQ